VVVIGLLAAVALWPEAVEVELTRVGSGPLLATVDEEGETRLSERFLVSAPAPGEVLRIGLEPEIGRASCRERV